jgi:RHS repeat-associated protein
VVDFAYDALDCRTQLTLPNGVVTEASYDAASRLTELVYRNATGVLGNLTYQYDVAGNRTQVGGSFARTLLPDPVASASYDTANRQRTFGDKQMTFDPNGNMTSITDLSGVTTFTWDARDQLAALTGSALNAAFAYDGLGRRSTRQVNAARADFLYDDLNPVQELSGMSVTANILSGLGVYEYFTHIDARGIQTLLTDALGSTLALTDDAGTVQGAYTYEPYGTSTTTGTAKPNPFQYVGRENDGTGLYYYHARYYLPGVQRFISEDPLGFLSGDLNLYAYVGGNPINYIDPTGTGRKGKIIKTTIKFIDKIKKVIPIATETAVKSKGGLKEFLKAFFTDLGKEQIPKVSSGITRVGGVVIDVEKGLLNSEVAIGNSVLYGTYKEKNPNRGATFVMGKERRNQLQRIIEEDEQQFRPK